MQIQIGKISIELETLVTIISTIATLIAVIVAIYFGRQPYKKKIYVETKNDIFDFSAPDIEITNIGNASILIDRIIIGYYFPQGIKSLTICDNENVEVKKSFPYLLEKDKTAYVFDLYAEVIDILRTKWYRRTYIFLPVYFEIQTKVSIVKRFLSPSIKFYYLFKVRKMKNFGELKFKTYSSECYSLNR